MAAITATAVIGAATVANSAYQGKKSREAAREASEAQAAAAAEGREATQGAFNTMRNDLSPYRDAGATAVPMLQNFATDPNAQLNYLQSNPLFQASLDVADRETAGRLAAQGRVGTGDQSMQLQQNYLLAGMPLLQAQEQRLTNMAQMGQNAAAQTGTAGLQVAGAGGEYAAQIANARAAELAAANQSRAATTNAMLQAGSNLTGAWLASRGQ